MVLSFCSNIRSSSRALSRDDFHRLQELEHGHLGSSTLPHESIQIHRLSSTSQSANPPVGISTSVEVVPIPTSSTVPRPLPSKFRAVYLADGMEPEDVVSTLKGGQCKSSVGSKRLGGVRARKKWGKATPVKTHVTMPQNTILIPF